MTEYCHMESPAGRLLLAGGGEGLKLIAFPGEKQVAGPGWREEGGALREAVRQLDEYFAGRRKDFSLKLAPEGSPFQLEVWRALQGVPYGETLSYGQLAGMIGRPKAARAVGGAVGRNPLPIVIPCHRVIGSDGGLTGFGGGLEVKKILLSLERRFCG